MNSRYLLLALLMGAFLLIIFGSSIIQVPEVVAVGSAIPNISTINATTNYTSYKYLPIIFFSPILYSDDFSNPASGWLTGDGKHISLSYENGEYEIEIFRSWWWGASAPPLGDISNYSIESEARLHTGSEGIYGVIFDREDWDNYYVFVVIPSSQVYAIFRHEPNDNWINLVPFTASTAIKADSATNQLKVEREGEKITVYVNDQVLNTTNDSTLTGTSSEVGLFAQTLNEEPIKARFDNFIVKQIPSTTTTVLSQNTVLPDEPTGQGGDGIKLQR